jgi:hypothetical protein
VLNSNKKDEFEMFNVEKIKEINKKSMISADAFANAKLNNGIEKIKTWLNNFAQLDFNKPFFRTTTGKYTYFVIDSEIIEAQIPRDEFLEISIDFWQKWKDKNTDYDFFWKVSGIGIHAFQKIAQQINPLRFKKVFLHLFNNKNGWKKYDGYLIHSVSKNNKKYRIAVDLSMCEYPKLIRWVYSPYWKIKNEEFLSIPIKKWNIDDILKNSTPKNVKIEDYTIPKFQFEELLGPEVKSNQPGFKNRYWKTGYDLNIPLLGKKLSNKWIKSINKIKNIIESAPLCIQKSIQYIKNNQKDHFKRLIILKYLQNSGIELEEIATYFRFIINEKKENQNPWKVSYYCNYYYIKNLKLDTNDQKELCRLFNTPNGKYFVLSKENCKRNNCKYFLEN